MAKNPADRFPDMRAFLDALRPERERVDQWYQTSPITVGWGQGQPQDSAQPERVLVEIDGQIVKEQPLSKPTFTVGRSPACDIVVPVESVSRRHAEIRWENGAWLIEDNRSLNGIAYQGEIVERHALKNGDRILLAPGTALSFLLRPFI